MSQTVTLHFGGPRPAVPAGHLPTALLDQQDQWVDPQGYMRQVQDLNEDFLLFVIDYLLANAKRIREAWAMENKQTYNDKERARRWMLQRPIMLAFMQRYVRLHDERVKRETEQAIDKVNRADS